MKTCKKCGLSRDESEYNKCPTTKDRLTTSCKTCIAIKSKLYYTENREKYQEKGKTWYQENKLKQRLYNQNWRKLNIEKKRAANKIWRDMNPDKVKVSQSKSDKKRCENLIDSHIAHVCFRMHTADVPKELIELKRIHIKLNRELKKLEK